MYKPPTKFWKPIISMGPSGQRICRMYCERCGMTVTTEPVPAEPGLLPGGMVACHCATDSGYDALTAAGYFAYRAVDPASDDPDASTYIAPVQPVQTFKVVETHPQALANRTAAGLEAVGSGLVAAATATAFVGHNPMVDPLNRTEFLPNALPYGTTIERARGDREVAAPVEDIPEGRMIDFEDEE